MIHRSPRPDVDVPAVSLSEHVLEHVRVRGNKPALVDGLSGETVTYAELDEMSARAAAGLMREGLSSGDVVALISHNSPAFAVACYAILRAGGIVTPINPELKVSEIQAQLRDSGASAVISTTVVAAKVVEAAAGTAVVRRFDLDAKGTGSFAQLLTARRVPLRSVDPNSTAVLPYSSGTTGTGKGVMLSHRNLVANLEQHRACWRIREADVMCAALPMFHVYGFNVILNSALLAGATLVTLPRFDLRTYLGVVQTFEVTRGHLAPPVLLMLAQAPDVDEFDLSSMRIAVSGAAPLDENTAVRVTERTGTRIVQGYGMTEAGPGTHCVGDDDLDVPAGSIGTLLPCTEARVVDPDSGADVEPGAMGELWVRGPQVMQGYLGRPDATADTLVDGWLRTGDVVQVSDENFFVVDRLKELIKYSGFQVAPAELEAVLLAHPNVRDAAVVGIPHPKAGEAPKAYVVREGLVEAEELLAWTAVRVASYKKVHEIEFIDEIPKLPTGKILRRLLKSDGLREKKRDHGSR